MDTDVLIVGAGPTGLMLANQLVRRGVRPLIIDRHDGPAIQTRALGVQARTLEIYAHLGIVERALELGKRATGANMWTRGRRAARVPFGDAGLSLSPYPYLLILGQDDNERLLGDALNNQGIKVQWNTELVGVAQKPDRAFASIKQPDGSIREISAGWVAGCDGARSAVRELTGIEFQGAPYEHVFFVADTEMTGPMVPDEVNVYLWRRGFHLFFPMRGSNHWRGVGLLPASLSGRDDLTLDDVSPSIRKEAGELSFRACSWFSTYRIHHRRAARFRVGRCFVMGDAAHIHSPVGAQGMNTGLQDAYNLGWKLALVVSGKADSALLDSYAEERIPVAQRLLSTTDRGFSFVVSDSSFVGFFRTRLLPRFLWLAMKFKRFQRLAFRGISQISIHYRDSRLSETLPGLSEAAPQAGDHFPWLHLKLSEDGAVEDLYRVLDDKQFTLILIGQRAPSEIGTGFDGLLRTLEVPDSPDNDRELARAGIASPSFYLLRPDGHVGLAGRRLDSEAIARYLSERIHVKAQVQTSRA